jgi:ketol-acid reductoisomerase
MAIVCFQVSKTAKDKIMREAGANVISGVKKRKSAKRKVSAKRKKR